MPVKECSSGGKPGYKYCDGGYCYTYTRGDEVSRGVAKQKAHFQKVSIESHRRAKE
jgi:hypothetical protein